MARNIERILITGAAGGLGRVMRQRLQGQYRLVRLSDIQPMDPAGEGEDAFGGTGFSTSQFAATPASR